MLFNLDKRILDQESIGFVPGLGINNTIYWKDLEFMRRYLPTPIVKKEIPRRTDEWLFYDQGLWSLEK